MNSWRVGVVAATIVAAVLVGWRAETWAPGKGIESKVVGLSPEAQFRLVVPVSAQHGGEIIAARAGLFSQVGLDLKLKVASAAYDSVASVADGKDVFGVSDSKTFLVAVSKGAPIVAFGAGYLESPIVFYSLERSQIHTPRDFVGKRVTRVPGSDAAIIYDALLANVGVSRGQVREVSGRVDTESLLNGDVDVLAGPIGEMSYAFERKGIRYTVIRPADYGIHVPGTVYFTNASVARDHPSIVQRFLNAVIAGWKMAYADYDKSVPLIAGAARDIGNMVPSDEVLYELKAQRSVVLPLGRRFAEFDDLQWKQLGVILSNERLVDDSVDLSKAVNYEFLKEAYRKPITFGH